MEKITVFVVDDNLAARKMLINMIDSQEDMQAVGDGGILETSLPQVAELKPDVLLLEIDVSGGALINDIMASIRSVSPDTLLILCTSGADDEFVIPAAESGATDFLMKPYNKGYLFRTIRNAAGRG